MYCKNCGKEIDDLAAVCIHCGVAVGNGVKYCKNCGAELPEEAAFCLKCGVAVGGRRNGFNTSGATVTTDPNAKSRLAAGLLAIFLGAFGVHNFYLGYNGKGIAQLLLWVFFFGWVSFIWGIIDAILIFTGKKAFDANEISIPYPRIDIKNE